MDERLFKKIKTMGNFILFYKSFFYITSIATILISVIIRELFNEDKFYINNFIDNWNKKPIEDVKLSLHNCVEGYEQADLGNWPITSSSCDCSDSFFYNYLNSPNKRTVIKPYPCNMLLELIGCKNSEYIKKFNINHWKGRRVCIKRNKISYLEKLLQNSNMMKNDGENKNCDCQIVDSLKRKLCSKECSLKNKDIQNLAVENKIKNRNALYDNRKSPRRLKKFKFMENYTTFDDLEMLYNKNFNISLNNENLENLSISDILMSEHYPCLIPNNYYKINEINHFLSFVLENIDYIKNMSETTVNTTNLTPNKSNFTSGKYLFDEINLKTLDKRDCFFYENSYFDRRHFIIDIVNFYQFLLFDMNDNGILLANMSLTYEDMSKIENYTPTTTMFLITTPFYGWNIKVCSENPNYRMKNILNLYDSASTSINIIVIFKLACLLYLALNGIFEKIFADYNFALYTRTTKNLNQNNCQMVFDMIYYSFNILILCQLIKLCFTMKNLASFQYLFIIRNDCLDEYSTKLLTYLYDVCEEKFIYCIFMLTFTGLEFILFTVIFKNSYDLKLSLS